MNKGVLAGLACAALATSTLAIAAATVTPPQPPHDLTFAELKADADKVFDRMDANHDGKIDAADRDARLLEHFAQWDTNHDGVVSKDEFLARVHAKEGERKDRHGPDHGPDHGDHRHGRMIAIIGPALHDARKDGAITRLAFDSAIKARFDAIDTNHDGKLSHDEMRAAHGHRGDERHGGGDWRHGDHDHGDMPPAQPATH